MAGTELRRGSVAAFALLAIAGAVACCSETATSACECEGPRKLIAHSKVGAAFAVVGAGCTGECTEPAGTACASYSVGSDGPASCVVTASVAGAPGDAASQQVTFAALPGCCSGVVQPSQDRWEVPLCARPGGRETSVVAGPRAREIADTRRRARAVRGDQTRRRLEVVIAGERVMERSRRKDPVIPAIWTSPGFVDTPAGATVYQGAIDGEWAKKVLHPAVRGGRRRAVSARRPTYSSGSKET
jgi:hypothetical protein